MEAGLKGIRAFTNNSPCMINGGFSWFRSSRLLLDIIILLFHVIFTAHKNAKCPVNLSKRRFIPGVHTQKWWMLTRPILLFKPFWLGNKFKKKKKKNPKKIYWQDARNSISGEPIKLACFMMAVQGRVRGAVPMCFESIKHLLPDRKLLCHHRSNLPDEGHAAFLAGILVERVCVYVSRGTTPCLQLYSLW